MRNVARNHGPIIHGPRMGIEGIIKSIELIDAATGIVERRLGPYRNIITDAGLNAIGNGTKIDTLVNYIAVGTSSTPPAATDTALGAETGVRTTYNGGITDVVTAEASYTYWEVTRTRVFTEAESNGNLTELGFFSANAGGTMWCHQLFRDELGDPTTLTKLNTQQLRITYAWRLYPDITVATDTLSIDGTSTDCDARAMRVDNSNGWGSLVKNLGAWSTGQTRCYETNTFPTPTGGDFSGTSVTASSATLQAYSNGNFYRDIDFVWDPGVANFATGIGAVGIVCVLNTDPCFGTTFTPKVGKTDVHRFTYTVRVSWARI